MATGLLGVSHPALIAQNQNVIKWEGCVPLNKSHVLEQARSSKAKWDDKMFKVPGERRKQTIELDDRSPGHPRFLMRFSRTLLIRSKVSMILEN